MQLVVAAQAADGVVAVRPKNRIIARGASEYRHRVLHVKYVNSNRRMPSLPPTSCAVWAHDIDRGIKASSALRQNIVRTLNLSRTLSTSRYESGDFSCPVATPLRCQ